jgi:hypothetical protein
MANDGRWYPPEQHQLKSHRTPSSEGERRVRVLLVAMTLSAILLLLIGDLLWR